MFQGIQTNDQTFCQNCNPAKTFMEEEEDLLTQKLGDIFLVRTMGPWFHGALLFQGPLQGLEPLVPWDIVVPRTFERPSTCGSMVRCCAKDNCLGPSTCGSLL